MSTPIEINTDMLKNLKTKAEHTAQCLSNNNESIKKLIERTVSEFVIPEGVKKIGSDAFYQCENLTEIRFPNSIEVIGDGAFRNYSKYRNRSFQQMCKNKSVVIAPKYNCYRNGNF